LTSKYVTDAMQSMKDGDNDRALWSLDKALYLDPTMADALQLKEQITGEKSYFYDRSLLKKAIDSVIDSELSVNADEEAAATETTESEVITADDLDIDLDIDASAEVDTWTQEPIGFDAESDVSEPTAQTEQADEIVEFTETADEWNESASTEQAEDSTELTEIDSQWDESVTAEQTPSEGEPAVEAPWRVELTGDDSGWQTPGTDDFGQESLPESDYEFNDSASVEVYDPDEFFTEEQEVAQDDQPINIFEFVEDSLNGNSEDAVVSDEASEETVTEVDTEEVND
jgi:hypothetical protein